MFARERLHAKRPPSKPRERARSSQVRSRDVWPPHGRRGRRLGRRGRSGPDAARHAAAARMIHRPSRDRRGVLSCSGHSPPPPSPPLNARPHRRAPASSLPSPLDDACASAMQADGWPGGGQAWVAGSRDERGGDQQREKDARACSARRVGHVRGLLLFRSSCVLLALPPVPSHSPPFRPTHNQPSSLVRYARRRAIHGRQCPERELPVLHPRRSFSFSLITLLPRHLHGPKRVVAFRPTTRSRPRLGLVVRCGPISRYHKKKKKNMPLCAFFKSRTAKIPKWRHFD